MAPAEAEQRGRPEQVASRAGRLLAAASPAMREVDMSAVVVVDPQTR